MALKKPIETTAGVPADYWRHGRIVIDMAEGRAVVIYHGHFSEASRRGGKAHLMEKRHDIPLDKIAPELAALQAKAYTLARESFQNGTRTKSTTREREVTQTTGGVEWTHTVHDPVEIEEPYVDRFLAGAESV